MKKYLLILISILLTSCSVQKRCEWHLGKAHKLGCYNANTDTAETEKTIKGDSLKTSVPIDIDSNALDSVLNEIKDTCIDKLVVKEIIKKIPIKVKPYYKEDSLYTLKIWIENNRIEVDLKIKDRKYKEKTITKNHIEIPPAIKIYKTPNSNKVIISLMGLVILLLGYAWIKK